MKKFLLWAFIAGIGALSVFSLCKAQTEIKEELDESYVSEIASQIYVNSNCTPTFAFNRAEEFVRLKEKRELAKLGEDKQ